MSMFALLLVVALFVHDAALPEPSGSGEGWRAWPAPLLLSAVLSLWLILGGVYQWLVSQTLRRLGKASAGKWGRRLEGYNAAYRALVFAGYVGFLAGGGLWHLRQAAGDWVLLDELVVIAPPLAMLAWAWWCYYPIQRAVRQYTLQRAADAGEPLPRIPQWTRWQYVLWQFRHQFGMPLAPLLVFWAWGEAVSFYAPSSISLPGVSGNFDPRGILQLAGLTAVFAFSPLIVRRLWQTDELPEGPLRQRLLEMCRRHGVRVRNLLLWHTHHSMSNAAVMGVTGPLRYILLTDALIERLSPQQIEAVMAHEIGHVARHHTWRMLMLAALTWVLSFKLSFWAVDSVMELTTTAAGWLKLPESAAWLPEVGAAAGAVTLWLVVFGWISRRFERQADTFAVQHLSRNDAVADQSQAENHDTAAEPVRISQEAVRTMVDSLQAVLELNHSAVQPKPPRQETNPAQDAASDLATPAKPPTRGDATANDGNTVSTANRSARARPTRLSRWLAALAQLIGSWRHGSIAWRQAYLRSLVGQPVDDLGIDRLLRRLHRLGMLTLLALVAWQAYLALGA